jgi:tripartite-type tricarboxylate transporter receptor subunit TctC
MSIVKTVFGRLMITLGAVFVAFSSSAQTYPQRPIKAIVPYAAGGFSDQASRIIVEAMSRNLGQNIKASPNCCCHSWWCELSA